MILIKILRLVLPVLIPSWRFFDEIAPSPRIEFAVLDTPQDEPSQWNEFRPRPLRLSAISIVKRLFWSPRWNETLFLAGCCERLMDSEDPYCIQEICKQIKTDLRNDAAENYFQFRLVFVHREADELQRNILYVSKPMALVDGETP